MAYLGSFGSTANKTAGSTVAITATSNIPAGTFLILGLSVDNITATTPTISSVTASGGGSWTLLGSASSGATATAGAGIFLYAWRTLTTTQINSGSTITTITLSGSVTSKAAEVWGWDFVTNALRNTVVTATSTSGAPSAVTSGTALVAGDLVIGLIAGETNSVATGDSDTTNGSWSTIDGAASSGGNANTNNTIGMQYKYVTATGNQTYNPTTSNDSIAMVFGVIPDHILPMESTGSSTSDGTAPADLTTPLAITSTGVATSVGYAPADLTTPLAITSTGVATSVGYAPAALTTPLQITSTVVSLSTGSAPVNLANRLQLTSTAAALSTGTAPAYTTRTNWVLLSM